MAKSRLGILDFFKRLWTRPVDELTRWQRTVKYSIDLARHCGRELRHDKAGQMAAALTYHTLFSLLPTIVLAMAVQFAFLEQAEREVFKQSVVDFLLPPVSARPAPAPDPAPAVETKPSDPDPDKTTAKDASNEDEPKAAPANRIDEGRTALAKMIQNRMDDLESINLGGIGVVGLLLFIYGATTLLSTAERSFNAIYGVARARSIFLRLPLYYTVITLGPIVMLAGQWAQKQFLGLLDAGQSTQWLTGPMIVLSPLLTTWLVLGVTYAALPNTRVQRRAAIIGSFVSAALVVGLIELFQLYVNVYITSFAVESIYGALAMLPLCLLWMYLLWLLVLFGLELTYTLQAMKDQQFKHEINKLTDDMLIDPTWLIPLVAKIADAFDTGEIVTELELSKALNLAPKTIQRLLTKLEEAGIVRYVDSPGTRGHTLARPADQVPLAEVVDLARSFMPKRRSNGKGRRDPAWKIIDQIQKAATDAAKQKTLADLL
jgi:membrane protein